MTCFKPLKAYRAKDGISFSSNRALVPGSSISVPCGQCIGCRLARAEQWATRCLHESKMHPYNEFVTLTFDPKNYPASGSVSVRDVQLFMKRLRKSFPQRIRFFACGEYGDQLLRPHYHLLLFNCRFADKKVFSNQNSKPIYVSERLQKLWEYGFTTTAPVNQTTAGYVARYAMKKLVGDQADEHYTRPHPISGQLVRVEKEFCLMSRRPGIGTDWFNKFKDDCYPSDFLIVDGKKKAIPRFYDNKLEQEHKELLKAKEAPLLHKLKLRRKAKANLKRSDNTPERLAVREELAQLKLDRKKRVLGDYT